jgi:putative ABC transport system permease protein
MPGNYLKIATRQLQKQKMYSVIKVGGFALGIAACILIALYIRDETSYDRSYPDADRIYRVIGEMTDNGKFESGADWPAPMANALKNDYPEVEKAGRLMPHELFYGAGTNEIRRADQVQNNFEDRFSYADQEMLDMLHISMVFGETSSALAEPYTMVISKSKADQYFPHENPVGKTMILNDDKDHAYRIGAVMRDFPSSSHIHYNFLLTMTGHELWKGEQTTWMASNYYTYILVKPGTNPVVLQTKLKGILKKYYLPVLRQNGDKIADKLEQNLKFRLQPISDIHLKSYNIDDGLTNGDIRYIWLFGAVACFILVLACINFINLSTARSADRAKEVGLRKVVGSGKFQLVRQFLTESVLYSVLSFLLGLALAYLLLPYFNSVSGKSLTIPWSAWWLAPTLLLSALLIGVLAGLYPAFYLSAFKPVNVLKGNLSRGSRNAGLRNVLVVFQFATSILLIVGTIVIYRQIQFLMHRKLGYDRDQVVLVEGANTLDKQVPGFKNELLKLPEVKSATVGDFLPVSGSQRNGNTFWNEGREKVDEGIFGQIWRVDYDYVQTMGMKILEGRNFSQAMASDSEAVIVNEAMVNKLMLKEPLIGKRIVNGWQKFHIIGVIQDFNFESMKQNVSPLCLAIGDWGPTVVSVKVRSADMHDAIRSITGVWKKFAPHQPFRYSFLDDRFGRMYEEVHRTGRIFTSFSVLAIVIACLGLFALSAFLAEQRRKEVSIRKVLGASISQVTTLLSRDFVRLVIIAFVIASPISWWGMNKWLQDYAYRTTVAWWIFAVAFILVILIAILTISFQAIKAAVANPANNLRTE